MVLMFQSTRPVQGATVELRPLKTNSKPFQSTRPVQGATNDGRDIFRADLVSIHAPRTGRDKSARISIIRAITFQSTRPVQGATIEYTGDVPYLNVSIHAPRTGRDSAARSAV